MEQVWLREKAVIFFFYFFFLSFLQALKLDFKFTMLMFSPAGTSQGHCFYQGFFCLKRGLLQKPHQVCPNPTVLQVPNTFY